MRRSGPSWARIWNPGGFRRAAIARIGVTLRLALNQIRAQVPVSRISFSIGLAPNWSVNARMTSQTAGPIVLKRIRVRLRARVKGLSARRGFVMVLPKLPKQPKQPKQPKRLMGLDGGAMGGEMTGAKLGRNPG